MPLDKKIVFAAINLNSKIPKKIGVKWIEYDEKDVTLTFRNANLAQTFTTDGRKETVITAPELPNPDADKAEEIAYPYTIQSVPPKSTETAGKAAQEQEEPPQQQETRTIRLLPGESQGIQLPAGSYTITETIQGPLEQIGFTMKVAGHPFGTTEANQKFEVQIGGRRTLTISKPAALLPGQAEDNRTYSFWVFGELVELRAGESKTVTLPTEGSYTITPHNDSLDTYQLNYTDSGAIYGTASGSTGSVTFTNSFSQGEYAYRYIHEYYLRDHTGDHWEGTTGIESQVSELGNTYTGDDVEQKPNFQPEGEMPYTYTWEQTLYGKMEPGAEDAAYNGPDGLYQINSARTAAQATRAGDQIIILRYFRQKPEGKYNIIHEYYCLDRDGRHHWEGATNVENLSGYLGDTYTGEAVEKKPEFQPPEAEGPYTYTWDKSPLYGVTDSGPGLDQYTGRQKIYAIDSARTAAQVTQDGNQIIILRYYRQPPADPPGTPDNPPDTPDNPPGTPDDPPDTPDDPPDTPDDPPKLTELPDPNDPGSSEEITIWEDGVPKTYIKIWQPEEEEWVYIPAEDVPLGQTPKTGDPNSTGLWILLALCSLTGLWMLALRPGRKE